MMRKRVDNILAILTNQESYKIFKEQGEDNYIIKTFISYDMRTITFHILKNEKTKSRNLNWDIDFPQNLIISR